MSKKKHESEPLPDTQAPEPEALEPSAPEPEPLPPEPAASDAPETAETPAVIPSPHAEAIREAIRKAILDRGLDPDNLDPEDQARFAAMQRELEKEFGEDPEIKAAAAELADPIVQEALKKGGIDPYTMDPQRWALVRKITGELEAGDGWRPYLPSLHNGQPDAMAAVKAEIDGWSLGMGPQGYKLCLAFRLDVHGRKDPIRSFIDDIVPGMKARVREHLQETDAFKKAKALADEMDTYRHARARLRGELEELAEQRKSLLSNTTSPDAAEQLLRDGGELVAKQEKIKGGIEIANDKIAQLEEKMDAAMPGVQRWAEGLYAASYRDFAETWRKEQEKAGGLLKIPGVCETLTRLTQLAMLAEEDYQRAVPMQNRDESRALIDELLAAPSAPVDAGDVEPQGTQLPGPPWNTDSGGRIHPAVEILPPGSLQREVTIYPKSAG
jgi:hypothetical protein